MFSDCVLQSYQEALKRLQFAEPARQLVESCWPIHHPNQPRTNLPSRHAYSDSQYSDEASPNTAKHGLPLSTYEETNQTALQATTPLSQHSEPRTVANTAAQSEPKKSPSSARYVPVDGTTVSPPHIFARCSQSRKGQLGGNAETDA